MPTTSWLVMPAGLSTTARPWIEAGLRRAIAGLGGARRQRAARIEDALDLLGGADDVVGPKGQHRCLLGAHLPRDRTLDAHTMAVQCLEDERVARLVEQRVEV